MKRIKENATTTIEILFDIHQPSPNHEWDVYMDDFLEFFNMEIREEFGAREANDHIGESSTHLGKS